MSVRPNAREHQILTFLCAGLTNKEIGSMLKISDRTVENYVSKLMTRYSARNRTHLAAKYQCIR